MLKEWQEKKAREALEWGLNGRRLKIPHEQPGTENLSELG